MLLFLAWIGNFVKARYSTKNIESDDVVEEEFPGKNNKDSYLAVSLHDQ